MDGSRHLYIRRRSTRPDSELGWLPTPWSRPPTMRCAAGKRARGNDWAALARAKLVRQQDRQFGRRQDVAGCPTEDHLAQSALRVGALDQKVGANGGRLSQDGLAWFAVA